ncbi:IS110 family transposase [Parapedobacter soli]|uniref:IS110 family transposase n=1 Tax=Parapedobacter soli TaxID=416955 RepID=UPI0021C6083C|nr:IS110 family transposase [Parapedobacter soli]
MKKAPTSEVPRVHFEQVVSRGCGLDVHEKNVVATVDGAELIRETRTFDTYTGSLNDLRDWLQGHGVTHVAMESTGVYWKPVFNILEEDFTVILVNARHLKNVPGRKTDRKDSQWICRLLLAGLLKASFIPEEKIRQLRDVNRYSTKLTQQLASEKNRIQKVLEDANIKLSSVVSNTSGVVSTGIIEGLMAGRTDLEALIDEHYHGKLKVGRAELLKAITGRMTDHHRFMLRQIKHHMAYLESQIAVLQQEVERLLADDRESIELLKTIPGVNTLNAVKMLAEVGTSPEETFGNPKRLAKWAGICPGNNESGGKRMSGRTTHGNKYLKSLLVEAAWAATRTKGTYLRAKYDSMAARKGRKKALLIIGHKILTAAYIVLTARLSYMAYSVEEFERRRNQKRIAHLQNELKGLGIRV